MKIIDKYIIRKFLTTYVYVISLFVIIAIVFDISEKIGSFIDAKVPANEIIFDYYLNFIPYLVILLSPLFIFIAVIFFTARMANQSEIVSILGNGVSFYRMLVPYYFASFLLVVTIYVLNSWILPNANKVRVQFDNKYLRGTFVSNKRNFHFRDVNNSSLLYYMESFSTYDSTGYKFTIEEIKDGALTRKLSADRIEWIPEEKRWRVHYYVQRTIVGDKETLKKGVVMDTLLPFDPSEFGRPLDEDISQMNDNELQLYLDRQTRIGSPNVPLYLVEKYKRIAMPVSTFILTLIGISLSSRKVRGGIGLHLAIGVGISFSYIMVNQFSTIFAVKGELSPLLSAWLPNILYFMLAVVLIRFAPK